MKFEKYVPDGTRVSGEGKRFVVFNPAWYRVDRWFFWLWMKLVKRTACRFTFSAVVRDEKGHRVEQFQLPGYEDR